MSTITGFGSVQWWLRLKRKGRGGNAKLESPIPNSGMPGFAHPFTVPGELDVTVQETPALPADPGPHFVLAEASLPGSFTSSTNDAGWHAATQYQVQAQPPSLKSSQACQSPGQKSDLPGRVRQSLPISATGVSTRSQRFGEIQFSCHHTRRGNVPPSETATNSLR